MSKIRKFPFDNVEIEVVKLSEEDVIATSGEVWIDDSWENVDKDGIDWS